MGLLTVLKKMKKKEKEMRLLLLGLDNAGKTTILKRFNGEDIHSISPTLGFNIKTLDHDNFKLNIWDVGGQKSLRSYWKNYFECTDGVIWVVDSADKRRLEDCAEELHSLLQEEYMTNCNIDDVKLTKEPSPAPVEEKCSLPTLDDELSKAKSTDQPDTEFETPVQPTTTDTASPKSKSSKYDPIVTSTPSVRSETFEDAFEDISRKKSSTIEVMKVLEFDYTGMIPDMRVLTFKKRRDWDFYDPDVIRAIFVEYETNAFSKWKVENLKIDMNKYPRPAVPTNRSYNLRMYSLSKKRAKVEKENRFFEKISDLNREIPQFEGQIRSNMTEELRRDFIRNKPSIPSHYMDHYAKYGKPPFKSHKQLAGATLLVFANKQDLPGALSPEEIKQVLDLDNIKTHHWSIIKCSAITGENLLQGIDWLIKDIGARIFTMD